MTCLSLWLHRLETTQSEGALTCFRSDLTVSPLKGARPGLIPTRYSSHVSPSPPGGRTGGRLIGLFFGGVPTWFVFGTPTQGGKKVDKRASVHHGRKFFKVYGPRLYAQIF